MAAHENHHYIPKFFLRSWQSGGDDKLSAMRWANGRLLSSRLRAKSVGAVRGLYGVATGGDANVIEREFFRDLDNRAALAHRILLSDNPHAMSDEHRNIWAHFLISLLLRTPEKIAEIRGKGSAALLQQLDRDPEEYERARPHGGPTWFRDWVREQMPALIDDFGVLTLPNIVQSDLLVAAVLRAHWKIRAISKMVPRSLVLGDRPLLYYGTMGTSFLMALPIAPRRIFFAYNEPRTGENLDRVPPMRMIRNINQDQARSARDSIFAADDSEIHIARAMLNGSPVKRTSSEMPGKFGSWPSLGSYAFIGRENSSVARTNPSFSAKGL